MRRFRFLGFYVAGLVALIGLTLWAVSMKRLAADAGTPQEQEIGTAAPSAPEGRSRPRHSHRALPHAGHSLARVVRHAGAAKPRSMWPTQIGVSADHAAVVRTGAGCAADLPWGGGCSCASEPTRQQVDEPSEDALPIDAQAVVPVLLGNPRPQAPIS
jgi:hypothetical protein